MNKYMPAHLAQFHVRARSLAWMQFPTVMLSLEDFRALEETAYLLRSPANARRLMKSIGQLNEGQGQERKLAERS
ncbi:type II toxin-antitoxin system Phd/YefM family antitoxin [Azohydromonas aeria]|uniref:type II toxin-antitoxin system Phd/YefM family antitoxin n=1 Tax=Azohydromonas aeria TaxID=2590212 RepID=UPI001E352A5B|nr:type II toxin-antitoxin system Phd/YefM family antitoxin [Azohydromonas aeria]